MTVGLWSPPDGCRCYYEGPHHEECDLCRAEQRAADEERSALEGERLRLQREAEREAAIARGEDPDAGAIPPLGDEDLGWLL